MLPVPPLKQGQLSGDWPQVFGKVPLLDVTRRDIIKTYLENEWEHTEASSKKKKPEVVGQRLETQSETLSGLDELHPPAASWWTPKLNIQCCSEIRLRSNRPAGLIRHKQFHETTTCFCQHTLHQFANFTPASVLTQVLRVDEGGPPLGAGTSSAAGPPAALPMVKLAAVDVHLVHDGVYALGKHARAVGVQVETAFLANDGLVHAALVALALVVRLRSTKGESL